MKREWTELIGKYELEGARTRFEDISSTLFKKIFRDQNVRKVEVRQGDGGVDIFVGEIGLEPISVIQCKFFPNGIDESQKNQIRESFKTVMYSTDFEVKDWTLCIINTLDLSENKWWSEWKKRMSTKYNRNKNFIYLKDGDDLIQLITDNDLYNTAFEKQIQLK